MSSRNSKSEFKKPSSSERHQRLQVNQPAPSTQQSQQQSQQIKTPQSASVSTTTTKQTFTNQTQINGMKPLLMQNIAGDGLWCQVKEENNRYSAMAEKFVEKKTKQAESKIESALVEALEKECANLGRELMREKARQTDFNLEVAQMKKIIDNLSVQSQEQCTEIMHLRNSKRNLEEQLEKTKEGYNALRRDINKAQSDSSMESQKSGDIKSIYIELKKQFEEYKNSMVERVKNLEEKLEEALEENDEIKGNLQLKSEIAERIDLERTKICRFEAKEQQVAADQDKRIEKIGRLIEENAILTEKLNESESFRKKFKEKNTFLDKQLKLALAEKEKIEGAYVQIKKRANDLSVLKTSNNKILDEKIKQLSKENEDLLSENKSLKNRLDRLGKVQQVEENDDEEDDLEEVTAKPFLFGPIDNGKF